MIDDVCVSSYMHSPSTRTSMPTWLTSLSQQHLLACANWCPWETEHIKCIVQMDGGSITRATSLSNACLPVQRGQPYGHRQFAMTHTCFSDHQQISLGGSQVWCPGRPPDVSSRGCYPTMWPIPDAFDVTYLTTPPRRQTTPVKTLPFHNFVCRR